MGDDAEARLRDQLTRPELGVTTPSKTYHAATPQWVKFESQMTAPMADLLEELAERMGTTVGGVIPRAAVLLKLALDAEAEGKRLVLLNPDGSTEPVLGNP